MEMEIVLFIYVFIVIFVIICEIILLKNDKSKYLKISYQSLKSICDNFYSKETGTFPFYEEFSYEINRFYNEYVQEMPQLRKHYPNVVVWIDAIIFRVDLGEKNASILKGYINPLKTIRDFLEEKTPFNKCEKYQQDILCDIKKMETPENEVLIQNIINRTEEEFLRLSGDIRKNQKLNIISIAIGIIGIVMSIISILMAIIKF